MTQVPNHWKQHFDPKNQSIPRRIKFSNQLLSIEPFLFFSPLLPFILFKSSFEISNQPSCDLFAFSFQPTQFLNITLSFFLTVTLFSYSLLFFLSLFLTVTLSLITTDFYQAHKVILTHNEKPTVMS